MLRDDLISGGTAIADFLGESERSTWHLIHTGQIPVIRKGRKIFARKSELEKAFSSTAAL